jgi:hypothetical protein
MSGRADTAGLFRTTVSPTRALAEAQPAAGPSTTTPAPADQAQLQENYGRLPVSFEVNQGQADAQVQFLAHGKGYSLALTSHEAVLSFQQPAAPLPGAASQPPTVAGTVLHMEFLGANAAPRLQGREELPGKVNYYLGNDPRQWHTNIATYTRVEYQNVYNGIDLVYYGNQQQLEYDFIVAPGADPRTITLGFTGANHLDLDQGDLVLRTAGGDIRQHKPFLYQDVGGVRQEIAGSFLLLDQHQVGFRVGAYDAGKPLVIDPPMIAYSSYLGGTGDDNGNGIGVDSAGNAYVTGYTTMPDLITPQAVHCYPPCPAGGYDAFVSQVDPTGSQLLWTTYLGGDQTDIGTGLAVGGDGNIYVTGYTDSTNFPTTGGPLFFGNRDGFVTKLDSSGILQQSILLPFGDFTEGHGIAVDRYGPAVTGQRNATPSPLYHVPLDTEVFVLRLDPNLGTTGASYVRFFGGNDDTSLSKGNAIALDPIGNAYVTGETDAPNFPITNGAPQFFYGGGSRDAFVMKLGLFGDTVYSTFLGGRGIDIGHGIAVDNFGNAYVIGETNSTNWPQGTTLLGTRGGFDVFVTEVNAAGAFAWTTLIAGSTQDLGRGIAVDPNGTSVYATGYTNSNDPIFFNAFLIKAFQNYGGGGDAFVTKLNANNGTAVYSSYLGGGSFDSGYGIAQYTNSAGQTYALVTGVTYSDDFPTTQGVFQPTFTGAAGFGDAFVTMVQD